MSEKRHYTGAIIWLVVGLVLIISGWVTHGNFLIIRGTDHLVPGGVSLGWLALAFSAFRFFRA